MTKVVLDVGNCPPDHAAIRDLIETHFDAEVLQAHAAADTLSVLAHKQVDLVLVNRKLDQDYSDGIKVIQRLKSTPSTTDVPVMLITNFAEHQQQAVQAGAEPGFGKLDLDRPATLECLGRFLS